MQQIFFQPIHICLVLLFLYLHFLQFSSHTVEQLIIDSAWLPLLTTLLHAIFSVMPFERFECSFIMPVLLPWCSSHISILSPAFLGIRSCLDLKIAWHSISANSAVTPVFPSVQSRTKNSHLSH